MLVRIKHFLLFSILLFIINFFTLVNLNFTQNQTLQSIGKIVAIVSVLLILLSFFLMIVRQIKNKAQQPQKTSVPARNKGKKIISLFVVAWLLIIFPVIGMNQMGILSKMIEGNGESLVGRLLFIILATVATIYPGLYFSPLIIFLIPLLVLTAYFLFSKSWHKWFDSVLIMLIFVLFILQIKVMISMGGK